MSFLLDLTEAAQAHRVELPDVELAPLEQGLVEATWRARMVNEHVSARVYGVLLGQSMEAGLPAGRQSELLDFAQEELDHARRCAGVVASLGAEPVATVESLPEVPRHQDVDPQENFLRNLISVCCLAETVATALISAEREHLRASPLEPVLTHILGDEVGHARFGWRLLEESSLNAETNARLGRYLPVAFEHLERHELNHLAPTTPPASAMRLGACDGAEAREIFYRCVEEVIVPRLEQHNLPAEQAWAERASVSR